MKKPFAPALAGVALLTACGHDYKVPVSPQEVSSSYTVTVNGLSTYTQSTGSALWAELTDQGVTTFIIGLEPTGVNGFAFVLYRTGAGRAPAGDYDFVGPSAESPTPEQFQMFGSVSPSSTEAYDCAALSGMHRVTASDDSRVRGSFTVQGECTPTDGSAAKPLHVTIEGSYDAERAVGRNARSAAHLTRPLE